LQLFLQSDDTWRSGDVVLNVDAIF